MSYTFLQEQGEVSSVDRYSDIPQSVLSKSKSIPDRCYYNDNETECYLGSPSGTMSAHSMDARGEEQLMLFAEDSPAKTSVPQERVPELPESVLAYGKSMPELLKKYGLVMSSRKTPRYCGDAGSTLSLETCPNWGMMQSGACWELGTSAHPTGGIGCGYSQATYQYMQLWIGTPTATMSCRSEKFAKGRIPTPAEFVKMWPTPTRSDYRSPNLNPSKSGQKIEPASGHALPAKVGGLLNPTWVEWLMGWPIGWTELKPLETDKYRQWQQQHGEYFRNKH